MKTITAIINNHNFFSNNKKKHNNGNNKQLVLHLVKLGTWAPACVEGSSTSLCSQPLSSNHFFGLLHTSSGLLALLRAPETPPSMGMNDKELAAFTIASTFANVMSPSTTRIKTFPTTEQRTIVCPLADSPASKKDSCLG